MADDPTWLLTDDKNRERIRHHRGQRPVFRGHAQIVIRLGIQRQLEVFSLTMVIVPLPWELNAP